MKDDKENSNFDTTKVSTMPKQKLLLGIPLIIIAGFIVYTWITIFTSNITARWQHYLSLFLFIILAFLFFKKLKFAFIATALFLLLGTANILLLTPSVVTNSFGVRLGDVELWTPGFQLLSFGILVLFLILNFDTLTDMYLDYKESKKSN